MVAEWLRDARRCARGMHMTLKDSLYICMYTSITIERGQRMQKLKSAYTDIHVQIRIQKSEREKPHSGKTKSQSPTKTPCNQPAIAILTHTHTQHRRSTHLPGRPE